MGEEVEEPVEEHFVGVGTDEAAALDSWVPSAEVPRSTKATGDEETETGTGAGVKLDAGTGASVEVEGNGSQEPESAVDAKT